MQVGRCLSREPYSLWLEDLWTGLVMRRHAFAICGLLISHLKRIFRTTTDHKCAQDLSKPTIGRLLRSGRPERIRFHPLKMYIFPFRVKREPELHEGYFYRTDHITCIMCRRWLINALHLGPPSHRLERSLVDHYQALPQDEPALWSCPKNARLRGG